VAAPVETAMPSLPAALGLFDAPPESVTGSVDHTAPAGRKAALRGGGEWAVAVSSLPRARKAVLQGGKWKVVSGVGTRDVLDAARAAPLPLPPLKQWQFAMGQFGSAALVGLVGVQLVSFYLPPIDSATGERLLPVTFVSQGTIWGVFNVVSMTAAVCRLW